jgi:hypothetical protein
MVQSRVWRLGDGTKQHVYYTREAKCGNHSPLMVQ